MRREVETQRHRDTEVLEGNSGVDTSRVTPNPARPWNQRYRFTPSGSPYWPLHILLLVAFPILWVLSIPGWVFEWPTHLYVRGLSFVALTGDLAADLIARRRHPEYFAKVRH